MKKFKGSVFIEASRERVWEILLNKASYKFWTKPFNPNSRFVGDWSEGSKILFLGYDESGENEAGMVSRIVRNIPSEFLSIEHIGVIKNGVEDTTSESVKSWVPAFENYTLIEKDGGTELKVEQDLDEQYLEMFEVMWDDAFKIIKILSEDKVS